MPKFNKIVSVLQKESVSDVSPSSLMESAARQLEGELKKRGLQPLAGHTAEDRLEDACRRYPELCQDGTVMKALVAGAGRALDDPYLTYLEPRAFAGLTRRMHGQQGPTPGFTIVKDHADDPVKILEVGREGPPALHSGDYVLSLDGQATASMSVEEARAQLVGAPGSALKLQVRHAEDQSVEELSVTRLAAPASTVECSLVGEGEKRFAHLRIRTFASTTPGEVDKALAELRGQEVHGIIVDLRNNGGGLVSAAVDVCANFLPGGTQVVTLQRRHQAEVLRANGQKLNGLPVVVLLNGESASAAEIMASALHDAKVATLVGTRSFGKGTVQRYISLGDGSGLKFTSARYRTPAGAYIHGTGIAPDVAENSDPLARGMLLLR